MTNGSLDFTLGQIMAQLENNDAAHEEIKTLLKEVAAAQTICNNKVLTLETKAKVWGGMAGIIMGAIISAIGWVIKH